MADPLESSRRKIARANEHLLDLESKIAAFVRGSPYERVIEDDLNNPNLLVHKMKLQGVFPTSIAEVTADVAQNLRNSLDNAAHSIALADGKINPKFTAFPFAGSLGQMASSLGRTKDLPPQIQSLFCGFQPYVGGDDLLWALNEICVTDKHKSVIPIGTVVVSGGSAYRGAGYFSMPTPHTWDRAKNEMELLTIAKNTTFNYDLNFSFLVAFNEIKIVDGQPVLRVLHMLSSKIESILMAIEAECRRLGIFK